jgi:hypothetical protein
VVRPLWPPPMMIASYFELPLAAAISTFSAGR